jgi:hypothetical protein
VEETCPYFGSIQSLIQHCVTSRDKFSSSKIRYILCLRYLHVCLVVSHSLSHSTLTLIDEYSISVEFMAVLELLTMELNGIVSSAFLFHYMIVSVHLVWAHER